MECECGKRVELEGADAREYADRHLEKLEVDTAQWTVRYVCPETGRPWLMDYPHSKYPARTEGDQAQPDEPEHH
ncbi:hypothetical protein OEB99_06290 [Actinotalea sp. M2MS4P-6]|uniref:hypothetical protein n=1 Tax=Actinotalea sp. M2MS4P-6 TaxID=2983762 RepID=UPI0021E35BA3|nr:hypothetical protein [Actinotalea sp. M2MS4P-6]MCV2393909.1 hypothetical protein [Actinotalea sp. M2MS4P-6]